MTPIKGMRRRQGRKPLWDEEDLNTIEVQLEAFKTLRGSSKHPYRTAKWRADYLKREMRRRGVIVQAITWEERDGWTWGVRLIGYYDDLEEAGQ